MTDDPEHTPAPDEGTDGWPEEYRDPRDRPHPETLRITVNTFGEARDEALDAARAVVDGEARPAVVSFSTLDALRKILTDRRVELLRALTAREDAAESISALADDLGRDYSKVHEDVTLLAQNGLVYLVEEAGAKRPYVPYRRIVIDVELADAGEEATTA